MDEKTRLLALAYLKQDKKPREVSEILDISYAQAVRLRKELEEAEKRETIQELFNVNEAVLEQVLEAAKKELEPAQLQLTGSAAIEGELESIRESISKGEMLEQEFQTSALALSRRINTLAQSATQAETVIMLAKALAELQTAFFAKGTNVQVNNFGGQGLEEYLRD